MGSWECYVNVHEPCTYRVGRTTVKQLRSGHKTIDACAEHWSDLYENWVAIAQEELDLENRWYNYLERSGK